MLGDVLLRSRLVGYHVQEPSRLGIDFGELGRGPNGISCLLLWTVCI